MVKDRSLLIGAHKGTGSRPLQERGVDEGVDHFLARFAFESPQPCRLRDRQTQARHLEKLGANTMNDRFKFHFRCPSFNAIGFGERMEKKNDVLFD